VAGDAPAEIVDPHCVRAGGVQGFGEVSPSGRAAGNPAFAQLVARAVLRTPDHGWAARSPLKQEKITKYRRLAFHPIALRYRLSGGNTI